MNPALTRSLAAVAVIGAVGVMSGLAGCASENSRKEPTAESIARLSIVDANYKAADALIAQATAKLVADQPLLVATIVNVDSLEQSSTLGRVVSENISSRFSQSGFNMIEMKFRNSVYMKRNEGELLLTREITDIARNHNAQAVIIGTYGVASELVYVNVKVVKPGASNVIAAYDYTLPLTYSLKSMLVSTNGGSSSYQR